MRLPHVEDARGLDVAIVGVPYDGGTSYRPGARLAPREIRAQSSLIRSYSYFQKVAPFDRLNVADVGDVDAPPVSIEKCYDAETENTDAQIDAAQLAAYQSGSASQRSAILAQDSAWLAARGPVCTKAYQSGGTIDGISAAPALHAAKITLVAGGGTAEKDAPAKDCALKEPFGVGN